MKKAIVFCLLTLSIYLISCAPTQSKTETRRESSEDIRFTPERSIDQKDISIKPGEIWKITVKTPRDIFESNFSLGNEPSPIIYDFNDPSDAVNWFPVLAGEYMGVYTDIVEQYYYLTHFSIYIFENKETQIIQGRPFSSWKSGRYITCDVTGRGETPNLYTGYAFIGTLEEENDFSKSDLVKADKGCSLERVR